MKLEGKFKKGLDLYLINEAENFDFDNYDTFYYYPFSMKYGVLEDFCDSIEIELVVMRWVDKFSSSVFENKGTKLGGQINRNKGFKTREEARIQAVLKAQEIYNKKKL